MSELRVQLEALFGERPSRVVALGGGCVADVRKVEFAGRGPVVVKIGAAGAEGVEGVEGSSLEVEGVMLRALAERSDVPVPRVLHAGAGLLVLEHVENDGATGEATDGHAAEILAGLHGVRPPEAWSGCFGFDLGDTLIGPLRQPCPRSRSWVEFYREHRLMHMTGVAAGRGRIGVGLARRLEALAGRVGELIGEPAHPSLVHGDVWSGNVLVRGGRVAALIDPSVHYAHAEVELAFIALFSTFGETFWSRYRALRPVEDWAGFRRVRRRVYALYPLLVHAALFGGGYGGQVEGVVGELGF
jgi:fructosamine-3-kinase